MKVLNFSHPINETCRKKLQDVYFEVEIIQIPFHLDFDKDFKEQVFRILKGVDVEWETESFAVILPGMTVGAALIVAAISGLSGTLPRIVTLKRNEDGLFDFDQRIDLHSVRCEARSVRWKK